MLKILILFLYVTVLTAQEPFFSEPRVSGTPLMPSQEYVNKYFDDLKKNDLSKFYKLTSLQKTNAEIGDEQKFIVLNLKNPQAPTFDSKLFVLKKTDSQINVWVEKAELNNDHVTTSVIESIYNGLINTTPSGSLDRNKGIFEIDVQVFGDPPDFDGNSKVDFLLTDIQDGWDGSGSFFGGFFNPGDQTTNAGSNKADILYIDTYPGIYNELNGNATYNTRSVLGTVSHEFQHLIQYANDRSEKTWVNEGLSELSSFLCGYGLRTPQYYLKNTHLRLSSWNAENSLPHYSRVALWTYYLYEKYGLSLITEISKNNKQSMDGINSALANLNIGKNIDAITEDFFKTLALNDPGIAPEYSFNWSALRYIKAIPNDRVVNYSFSKDTSLAAYSFRVIEFTNGDSLSFSFSGTSVENLFVHKTGFGNTSYYNELFSTNISEVGFGEAFHTYTLYILNNSSQGKSISINASATQKYNLKTVQYGADEPTFAITSSQNTNAIQFISESDTTLLKSIEFYNSGGSSDVNVHLYNTSLSTKNRNPSSESFLVKNIVNTGWTRIDVEDLQYIRDKGKYFDAGINFVGNAAMGYVDVTGNTHIGRSFLKQPFQVFKSLDELQTLSGQKLTGSWMIRMELATPFSGTSSESRMIVSPNPFPATGSNFVTIKYTGSASNFELKIYNTLGQQVFRKSYSSKTASWDGKNDAGNPVASGMYIAEINDKNKPVYVRFILIR